MKNKKKIYNGEVIAYSILGVVWFLGLLLCVLGVCAYNVGKLSYNKIYALEQSVATLLKMKEGSALDFRLVGSLIMILAMIGFLIAIYVYVNKETTELAEERRRAERRRILMEEDDVPAEAPKAEDKVSE